MEGSKGLEGLKADKNLRGSGKVVQFVEGGCCGTGIQSTGGSVSLKGFRCQGGSDLSDFQGWYGTGQSMVGEFQKVQKISRNKSLKSLKSPTIWKDLRSLGTFVWNNNGNRLKK